MKCLVGKEALPWCWLMFVFFVVGLLQTMYFCRFVCYVCMCFCYIGFFQAPFQGNPIYFPLYICGFGSRAAHLTCMAILLERIQCQALREKATLPFWYCQLWAKADVYWTCPTRIWSPPMTVSRVTWWKFRNHNKQYERDLWLYHSVIAENKLSLTVSNFIHGMGIYWLKTFL